MRKLSTFLRDNFILIIIASMIGYVAWKSVRQAPNTRVGSQAKNTLERPQSSPSVDVVKPGKRAENIESQRRILAARLAINSRILTPKITEQGVQMTFRLQPSPRACKDGDIDLMEQIAGKDGKILLTLEDDKNDVLASQVLDVKALKTPYPFPVSFQDTGRPRIFRISLCSETSHKSCKNLEALDFKAVSQKLAGATQKPVDDPYVFYAYSFGLIKNEIHLFDGTNLASKQNYSQFLKTVNGTRQQLDFIDETVAQQRKLGILPLNVENQNVVFPLYFNDKSKCLMSITRR